MIKAAVAGEVKSSRPKAASVTPIKRENSEGVHPYAAAAVAEELARLDNLPRPWTKNSYWDATTFEVAANLIELANSPWSGYSISDAEADLYAHAPSDSSWGRREHEKKWESAREKVGAGSRPQPQPGEAMPAATVLRLDPQVEAEFWGERPVLKHLHDFSQARMAAPWAVLGVTLARVLALTPWTVHLPAIVGSAAPLNFAVALVAPSGGGKGAAEGVAKDAIQMRDIPEHRIGSGEAIAHCLKSRVKGAHDGVDWNSTEHNALINITEVDKLTSQAQRQGATIMPELRAAWSGESLGHVTADASRRIPVEKGQYRLALILGVQPGRAGGLLDDSDGGFPQRLIWLPAIDPNGPELEDLPAQPAPITWEPPRINFVGYNGMPVEVCEQAVSEVRRSRHQAYKGEGDPLDGHLLLARLKVGAALGILDGRYEVSDDDWRLAGVVVDKSTGVRERLVTGLQQRKKEANRSAGVAAAEREEVAQEVRADNAIKRICPRILRKLERAGDWLSDREIERFLGRDHIHSDEALRHLEESGQVVRKEGENGVQNRLPPGVT